jgi:hypothetical protein
MAKPIVKTTITSEAASTGYRLAWAKDAANAPDGELLYGIKPRMTATAIGATTMQPAVTQRRVVRAYPTRAWAAVIG